MSMVWYILLTRIINVIHTLTEIMHLTCFSQKVYLTENFNNKPQHPLCICMRMAAKTLSICSTFCGRCRTELFTLISARDRTSFVECRMTVTNNVEDMPK